MRGAEMIVFDVVMVNYVPWTLKLTARVFYYHVVISTVNAAVRLWN